MSNDKQKEATPALAVAPCSAFPTPRTDEAWHKFNESASAIPFRDFARQLESELAREKHARRNAERVAADALSKRAQAEADRDKARAERDAASAAIKVTQADIDLWNWCKTAIRESDRWPKDDPETNEHLFRLDTTGMQLLSKHRSAGGAEIARLRAENVELRKDSDVLRAILEVANPPNTQAEPRAQRENS